MKRGAIVAEPAGLVFREDREHAHQGKLAGGAERRRWVPTIAIDRAICGAYDEALGGDRQAIKRCAASLGWPRQAVIKRAAELGLARVKESDWDLAEIALLKEWRHVGALAMQVKLRAEGYHRTKTAIVIKRRRMGLVGIGDGYSATSLSKLLGIDAHAVQRWIDGGLLRAVRRETERTKGQGGDSQYIAHADVVEFLFAYPEEIDLRKVDKWWFLDLATDGRIRR